MAPKKTVTKSPPATRKRQPTKNNLRDEDVMFLWKLAKLNHKEVGIAALAKELNLNVGAARMRWSRLKVKLEAFEKKMNETAAATVASADTSMEDLDDTKGAIDTEELEGVNSDEGAK
ncbi:hypothetical protein N7471_009810 [Penicillium samsonianum]|uniref:uncharacterized protein n=1 Tax=Penicillium samsonianum TaxID=1882272 RepID=UPI002548F366|nr:uncharacterized protein N7471_009810 [Penicillium samsonianum]KAJ6128593.1 hypothetical protein N7471_009810 [Penicillium samsonianum]